VSTWSRPYLQVTDAHGRAVPWDLPADLPLPAGAASDPALRTPLDLRTLGLPDGGKLEVRWRTPALRNPRRRTFGTEDLAGLALACDVQRAHAAGGAGWSAGSDGWPAPAPAARDTRIFTADRGAARSARPVPPSPLAYDPTARTATQPSNPVLQAVRDGQLTLGATVDDVIERILHDDWAGWGPKERSNKLSAYAMVSHALRYREPYADDTTEITAWKRARLALDGVEEDTSMHVMLLLTPDMRDAINIRRYTDRRIQQLNEAATVRYEREYDRWRDARAAKERGDWRGGRMPRRPVWRGREIDGTPVSARTEELFAQCLARVLRVAESNGMLVGPNPWTPVAADKSRSGGYRRARPLQIHERNVAPIGKIIELAETLATTGPTDTRTGRPVGDRYKALVLAATCGARPSELLALRPADLRRTHDGRRLLAIGKSATPVSPQVNDGVGWSISDRPKGQDAGTVRFVDLPTYVADAIDQHIAAGYSTPDRLFTAVQGGPVRLGNIRDELWRPAVEKVFGHSKVFELREMEFRWIRKSALTWMLRAGIAIPQVARIAGHSPAVLLEHYAGVTNADTFHAWDGDWDRAWAWAAAEVDIA